LNPDPVVKLNAPKRFRGDKRLIVNVSWIETSVFFERLVLPTGKDYTLPSEGQWEYACLPGGHHHTV
jgi:formylglycine-generating enzyme required for sulfatase activity